MTRILLGLALIALGLSLGQWFDIDVKLVALLTVVAGVAVLLAGTH